MAGKKKPAMCRQKRLAIKTDIMRLIVDDDLRIEHLTKKHGVSRAILKQIAREELPLLTEDHFMADDGELWVNLRWIVSRTSLNQQGLNNLYVRNKKSGKIQRRRIRTTSKPLLGEFYYRYLDFACYHPRHEKVTRNNRWLAQIPERYRDKPTDLSVESYRMLVVLAHSAYNNEWCRTYQEIGDKYKFGHHDTVADIFSELSSKGYIRYYFRPLYRIDDLQGVFFTLRCPSAIIGDLRVKCPKRVLGREVRPEASS